MLGLLMPRALAVADVTQCPQIGHHSSSALVDWNDMINLKVLSSRTSSALMPVSTFYGRNDSCPVRSRTIGLLLSAAYLCDNLWSHFGRTDPHSLSHNSPLEVSPTYAKRLECRGVFFAAEVYVRIMLNGRL